MAVAPYGSWRSPITPDALVERVVRLSDLWASGGDLWWNESRPNEAGRQVVVRYTGDTATDAIPSGFSARTTVHEYGGGSFTVDAGRLFFSNFDDQRLWRIDVDEGGEPRPLTPEPPHPKASRYADLRVTAGGDWLICVRERHTGPIVNDLVAVPVTGGEPVALAGGRDFFSAPRPRPDGRQMAWLAWDQPNMPWDAAELWVAELVLDGDRTIALQQPRWVAGGADESVSQPRWSPEGTLHWVSDRSGWWNLYADDGEGGGGGGARAAPSERETRARAAPSEREARARAAPSDREARPLAPRPAEFSRPDWVFGQSTYTFLPDGRIVTAWSQHGIDALALLDAASGRFEPLVTPYTSVESVQGWASGVAAIAASPTEAPAVVELPLNGGRRVLRRSRPEMADPAFVSEAQPVEFPTSGAATAHALYYPPANPGFDGPSGERPPLLVVAHGGPTAAASPALDLGVQFWTTRGIAVVAVNYGGSTGYGRAYRQRLDGNWGVVDVDDCVNAALHLAGEGVVDGRRVAIRGSSAGGFTALAALVSRDVFAAGTSLYGIADLELLAADTHKFEARYLDRLVGPWPQAQELYRERSPLHHADRITAPVAILQGSDDAVVPLAQAEAMVGALRSQGRPFAYVVFPGEQHGFRQADSIRRAAEVELSFYGRVLRFEPAGNPTQVLIENLPPR